MCDDPCHGYKQTLRFSTYLASVQRSSSGARLRDCLPNYRFSLIWLCCMVLYLVFSFYYVGISKSGDFLFSDVDGAGVSCSDPSAKSLLCWSVKVVTYCRLMCDVCGAANVNCCRSDIWSGEQD